MLPAEVLEASAKALVDFQGKGFGIAECSHRGKEFDGVLDEAIARCKSLLSVPDTHDILFLQGGATQLFNTIPMNFLNGTADYVVSGEWSKKAASSAQGAYGEKIRVIGTSESTNFDRPRDGLDRRSEGRVPARLLERDGARPPAGRMAGAPEPGRRLQLGDDVAAAPDRAHGAGLRGRAEEPRPGGRGADDRAQGPLRTDRQEPSRRSGASRRWPRRRAASTRRRRSASTSCSRRSSGSKRRAAWRLSRSATPRRRRWSTARSTRRAASTRGRSPRRRRAAT